MMNESLVTDVLWQLKHSVGDLLPAIFKAFAILAIGWIVALIGSALVRKGLSALNKRAGQTGSANNLQDGLSKGVFWIVMLIAILAALNAFQGSQFAGPLNGALAQTFAYLPKLAAGGALALVGWLVANFVRLISTKALAATSLDEKLLSASGTSSTAIDRKSVV